MVCAVLFLFVLLCQMNDESIFFKKWREDEMDGCPRERGFVSMKIG